MNSHDLAILRREYAKHGLSEQDVARDPVDQFARWMKDAIAAKLHEPNAMNLVTVSPDGAPAARMVLLKDFSSKGFVFFTNYESRKSRDLASNPNATLLFYWAELERQARISGTAAKIPARESEAYFNSRPRDSQLGAWTSPQSHVVPGREFLDGKFIEMKSHYEGKSIPCPPHWGGYCLVPRVFEFWQGRPNRLHDRIEFVRANDQWSIHRLAP